MLNITKISVASVVCLCFAVGQLSPSRSLISEAVAQERSVLSGGLERNSQSMFSDQRRRDRPSSPQRRAYQRSAQEPELPDWNDRGEGASGALLPPLDSSEDFGSDQDFDLPPMEDFSEDDFASAGVGSSAGTGTSSGTGSSAGTGSSTGSSTGSGSSGSNSTREQVRQNSGSSGGSGSTFIVELRLF